MDPIAVASLGISIMFVLIVFQVPIGISMALAGMAGFTIMVGLAPAISLIATESASALGNLDLAVVPLFLLMGSFATAAGISEEIYNISAAFMGHFRGGLAVSTIGGCSFFGAICGSSPATVATFGRVAFPEMIKRNYSPSFASGCIAAGGTLGSLVPPSVIIIIYAVMAEEFIIEMFIAALIPAVLEISAYLITILIIVRIRPAAGPAGPRMSWKQRLLVLRQAWKAVIIAVAVIGGIYTGIFTVNEAASVGVVLSLIFFLISGKLTPKRFWETLIETANTTAMIFLIIIGANVFSYFLTLTHLPESIVSLISSLEIPNLIIIFILILIYFILGSIFDTVAAMLITLPIVLPMIVSMGYSPIWWGIINVVIIEVGMITPPIGLNVFVLNSITRLPLGKIYRGTLPFVIADIFRIALLVLFPAITLWLPTILMR